MESLGGGSILCASVLLSVFVASSFGAEPAAAEQAELDSRVIQLAAHLDNSDAQVRIDAAERLSKLGAKAVPATVPLAAALSDPNPLVRLHAVKALGRVGQSAACVAAAAMIPCLEDSARDVAAKADGVLSEWRINFGLGGIRVLHESDSLLRLSRGNLEEAQRLLDRKGFPLSELIYQSKFLSDLDSDNPYARENAAAWIRRFTSDDGEQVFFLRSAILKDRMLRALGRPGIRWNILLSRLNGRDPLALQLLPTIYRVADDEEREAIRNLVRENMEATVTLNHPARSDPSEIVKRNLLVRIVRMHINSNNPELQTYARKLQEQIRPNFLPNKELAEPNPNQDKRGESSKAGEQVAMRIAAVKALAEKDPRSMDQLEMFAKKDTSLDVRHAAIRRLGDWKEAKAGPILLEMIGNEQERPELRLDALTTFRRLAARERWRVDALLRDVELQLAKFVAVDEIQKILVGQSALTHKLREERKAQVQSLIATP